MLNFVWVPSKTILTRQTHAKIPRYLSDSTRPEPPINTGFKIEASQAANPQITTLNRFSNGTFRKSVNVFRNEVRYQKRFHTHCGILIYPVQCNFIPMFTKRKIRVQLIQTYDINAHMPLL